MAKRRLPVLNASPNAGDDEGAAGGFFAWTGVAFFAALLVWLVLASIVSAATPLLVGALPSHPTASLASVMTLHVLAFFSAVCAAGFLVGKFGAPMRVTTAMTGAALVLIAPLALAARVSFFGAVGAAALLVPSLLLGARLGFRLGRMT